MAVIQEAWISSASIRRVDDLAQAMGLSGISKSTVPKLCMDKAAEWPRHVSACYGRPVEDLAGIAGDCRDWSGGALPGLPLRQY